MPGASLGVAKEQESMSDDENDFSRGATMRTCSSLAFETAMWQSIRFLKDFIPVDLMFLHFYQRDLWSMRTIAGATDCEGRKLDLIAPCPKQPGPTWKENIRSCRLSTNRAFLEKVAVGRDRGRGF
jgi:hypothetical protein